MKLHFEPDLDYQRDAINAVCDLFRGQESCRTEFTVTMPPQSGDAGAGQQALGLGIGESTTGLGIGNRLTLLDDELLKNLKAVQMRGDLRPSDTLTSGDFTVEMETGTGKTYVYLRTIFDLNKRYGFTKFVIVVPSVAIKEGVRKSIEMMEDHFRGLYAGAPFDYFVYDSAKLGQVRNFAVSSSIQIMIVTVSSINKFGDEEEAAREESDEAKRREKSKNVMYRDSEKTGGERPIDLICATRPILIVDEPQSVDGGVDGQGKKALAKMNPLCQLRYSATHRDKHHPVYRLDAVDAYERKLVKQIEVASATVQDSHNKPYVRLVDVSNKKGVSARIEVEALNASDKAGRKVITVLQGDDLEELTRLRFYANYRIGDIWAGLGQEYLELQYGGGQKILYKGDDYGGIDRAALVRQMIRRTINEHLDKEKRLRIQGIKVLSLFFVDEVSKYRLYDDTGNPSPGEYARIFEEEYVHASKLPRYKDLFGEVDWSHAVSSVHDGYFAKDRKTISKGNSVEIYKDSSGKTSADDSAYNLIMRDKELLLSFETPLKFIFSHSALREGWDNPNVFQICVLREMGTEGERRQTIGRGLRLCVNKDGERVRGFDVNTLTVVATEKVEDFAKHLQTEIETDTGIKFGIVEQHAFQNIAAPAPHGEPGEFAPIGVAASDSLWAHLKNEGYLQSDGKATDALRVALKDNTLALPEKYADLMEPIAAILRKRCGSLQVNDADKRETVAVRRAVLDDPEFKALWDRIKPQTTYRVTFDNEALITNCARALRKAPDIQSATLQFRKADVAIGQGGVTATEKSGADQFRLSEGEIALPDLLTDLQDRTQLTRRSIRRILMESERLPDFTRNPQAFIETAAEAINRCKRLALVDGIQYRRLGKDCVWAQELLVEKELTGYLKNMVLDAKRSVYEHVVCDSDTERAFATQLEHNNAVKVYAKLPGWFTIPTPLGDYNPDWAVVIKSPEDAEEERLYFVVETKSSLFTDEYRSREEAKIECAKAHFIALEEGCLSPARYSVTNNLSKLLIK